MAERYSSVPLTLAFQERANTELTVLNNKLHDQLKHDITRIYKECLFADLDLFFHSGLIHTHRSLLKARAPKFYSEICLSQSKSGDNPVLDKINRLLVESFIREIYNANVLKHKEDAVIAQFKRINCVKESDPGSPESDVFLTPKASPSEAQKTFSGGDLAYQKCGTINPEPKENIHKINSLYYSLVHVEDDFNPTPAEKTNILEKELAEQDELFKSFQSIIVKEGKIKAKKPVSLNFSNFNRKLKTKSCLNDEKTVTKSKSCGTRLCKITSQEIQKNSKLSSSYTQGESRVGKNFTKPLNFTRKIEAKPNDALQVENACRNLGEMSNKKCFLDRKEHDDVMSNPENDLVGPDSCLEAGSSGYITGGGTPKDITGSEGFGIDITEVASGGDIPHDNDIFPVSSSASSDAGTWDSTFHTNEDHTFIEDFNPTKNEPNPAGNDSALGASIPTNCDEVSSTNINVLKKNDSLCSVGVNSPTKKNEAQDSGHESTSPFCPEQSLNVSDDSFRANEIQLQCSQETSETMRTGSSDSSLVTFSQIHNINFKVGAKVNSNNIPSLGFRDNSYEETYSEFIGTITSKEENTSVKTNYFIDAATLLDENEVYVSSSIVTNSGGCSLETKSENERSNNFTGEDIPSEVVELETTVPTKDLNELDGTNNDPSEVEAKTSIIRRNTFELEPDDEKLALLRQEYEKRQGNSLFQSSTSSENSGINMNSTEDLNLNKSSKSVSPKMEHPNSLFRSHSSSFVPNVIENEVHSPDSLNNDTHAEDFLQENGLPHKDFGDTDENVDVDSVSQKNECNAKKIIDIQGLVAITSDTEVTTDVPMVSSDSDKELNKEKVSLKSIQQTSLDSFNKIECTPIVSGGTLISDIPTEAHVSSSSSPMTRRKTEFAPIISGGLNILPDHEPKQKIASPLSRSWIVDMSDSGKSPPQQEKSLEKKSSHSGLGFFIPLDDPFTSLDNFDNSFEEKEKSLKSKETSSSRNGSKSSDQSSSCGFFIDLKSDPFEKENETKSLPTEKEISQPEKKLFSMFIEIGENCNKSSDTSPKSKTNSPFLPGKKSRPRNQTDRFHLKNEEKNLSTSSDSSMDTGEHPEVSKGKLLFSDESLHTSSQMISDNSSQEMTTKKQSFFMFIEANSSPLPKKRTLPSGLRPSSQRHSWNDYKKHSPEAQPTFVKREHKRANSISIEKSHFNNEVAQEDRFRSGPASIEESSAKTRESRPMMSSWHGPIKPSMELCKILFNGTKHELKDIIKDCKDNSIHSENENMDKVEELSCSIKSDDVYDISNRTNASSKDEQNKTFILDDVSKVVNANTNDLELSTPSHDIISDLSKDETETDPVRENLSSCSHTTNRSDDSFGGNELNEATPKICEKSASQQALADNEPFSFVKLSDMDKEPLKAWSGTMEKKSSRMSRSIPEGSWLEEKMITQSATSRSLSRLFPHLYRKTPDPEDTEVHSSTHSSMQSSFDPSGLEYSTEGTEGSSTSGGPCSRLGEDLLRMFLEEISPDVTVEVGGRRIKAHKCILSSRCQYFAGILSGGWVESAGNVISLQGFSYNTVHFALCHIYSGASNVPDTINIVELATLADMLCLEGLKEVITYTLKVKYCHFFHKPCGTCTVGVLECLPLAAAYGLDEIYRKSLRWITRHYVRVWPTKEFATLPKELQDKCYKQHIIHMCGENVLDTVMCCDKLEAVIPNIRWAQPVFALNSKLHDAAVKFLTQHFSGVISSDMFLSVGKEDAWTVGRIEGTLLSTSHTLTPEQACLSYGKIKSMLTTISTAASPGTDWKPEFVDLLCKLDTNVEDCLVRQAGRAARTSAWGLLELPLRRKIQDMACLVFLPGDERRRPRHSSVTKRVDANKSFDEARTNKAKAPEPVVKDIVIAPKVQAQNPCPPRTKKLSQVKSRYLEPKPLRREPSVAEVPKINSTFGQRRVPAGKPLISSSDSSRTSSPATTRALIPRSRQRTKETERLTMSTDSLCETKPTAPMKSASTKSVPDNRTQHTPIPSRKNFPSRTEPVKVKSAESLPERNASPLTKLKNGITPTKKSNLDGSPSSRLKSAVSTPSPSLRRSAGTVQNTNKTPEPKRAPLNRTSTFRVSQKPSSPSKTTAQTTRETTTTTRTRGNVNKEPRTSNIVGKSILNNNSSVLLNGKSNNIAPKSKILTVGSRSGTFLKDEPTVLKKPDKVIE